MVRIVRLSLEAGVSFPQDLREVDWPEVALRKQRGKKKGMNATPAEPPPKRRRGRPRKISPQGEWPLAENPSHSTPIPAESDPRKD